MSCEFEEYFGRVCSDCGGDVCICEVEMSDEQGNKQCGFHTAVITELRTIRGLLSQLVGACEDTEVPVNPHILAVVREPRLSHIEWPNSQEEYDAALNRPPDPPRQPTITPVTSRAHEIAEQYSDYCRQRVQDEIDAALKITERDLQIKNGFRPQLEEDINGD